MKIQLIKTNNGYVKSIAMKNFNRFGGNYMGSQDTCEYDVEFTEMLEEAQQFTKRSIGEKLRSLLYFLYDNKNYSNIQIITHDDNFLDNAVAGYEV